MLARATAHISEAALRANLSALSARAEVPLLPTIKADAYGHGLEIVARMAARHPDVWGLAVATPREAEAVARLDLGRPVVLLGPPAPEEVGPLTDLGVRVPVGSLAEAEALPGHARAHLKVDTGMNRLGARPEDAVQIARRLAERGLLEGVYTHFASADEPDLSFTHRQFARFQAVLAALPPTPEPLLAHASNSGGILSLGALPGMRLARPGLASYGLTRPHLRGAVPLRPIMTLRARVNQVHLARAGEPVSYGGLWTAPQDTRLAVLGAGYADGYPRRATGRASVLIGSEWRPVRGSICMDQMMVDVTGLDIAVGDWAELWGEGPLTVSDVAHWSESTEYEVLSGLGNRIERRAQPA